jgi:myo-inositol 2-dehydrogenase/D-chiro-inositol 1-dehydrogenase
MSQWWVPGLQIGYEHTFVHQLADFLKNQAAGVATSPTFREALATEYVTNAVLQSAHSGKWESCRPA